MKARHICIDVEADGPAVGLNSMILLGVCTVFEGERVGRLFRFQPITPSFDEEALAVSGFTRKEVLEFPEAEVTTLALANFLKTLSNGQRIITWSDNPAFDWQWVNYYLHRFSGSNILGHSCRRIGDLYSGTVRNLRASNDWKAFRVTKHDHNPLNDAIGNAEALESIVGKWKPK